jgi:hypothetical protein
VLGAGPETCLPDAYGAADEEEEVAWAARPASVASLCLLALLLAAVAGLARALRRRRAAAPVVSIAGEVFAVDELRKAGGQGLVVVAEAVGDGKTERHGAPSPGRLSHSNTTLYIPCISH